MFFVKREKGLFLSVYVDDVKLARKKQNINSTWKIFMKDVDLGEPTSFLDHVYLACSQRECQMSKDVVDNHRCMFESRISARATEQYCELAKKQLRNYIKSRRHAWMIINSKKKKMDHLENCQQFAHKLF